MKQRINYSVLLMCIGVFFLVTENVSAADKVVVIPLGGTVGNATAADVIQGKTFSSRAAGKGTTGTLKLRAGATIYTNSIGMEFSLIPAGSFVMGSPDGSNDTGHPPVHTAELSRSNVENQHYVTLTKSFYMQTTEVTQGQWLEVVGGTNPSYFDTCGMDCPVEMVVWDDAQNFIDALNAREGRSSCNTIPNSCYALPTEAQWEYAARAGTMAAFYNGNITQPSGNDPNLNEIGWYNENSGDSTHPVAQKVANNWGLYDMSGNVVEWCRDLWDWQAYSPVPLTDPVGASGSEHMARGGSWYYKTNSARSAMRRGLPPDIVRHYIGFRLVLPPGL